MNRATRQQIEAFRQAVQSVHPSAAWVQKTRQTVVMQVSNTLPRERVSMKARVQESWRTFVPTWVGSLMRKPVMGFASLFLVIAGGSIMSVSAAERSLPGEALYGLKIATEQARLAWTTERSEKLKLKTEFTQRRVQEIKDIVSTKQDSKEEVKQVAEVLKRDLGTLNEQLKDVKENGASAQTVVEAAKLVDEKTIAVIKDLEETKSSLSPEVQEKVTEAQSAAADTSVKAIEVLAQTHQEESTSVLAKEVVDALEAHVKTVSDVANSSITMNVSSSTTTGTTTLVTFTTVVSATTTSMTATGSSAVTSATTTTSTSVGLPEAVDRVKDITNQAFAIKKVQDQQEVKDDAAAAAASSTSMEKGSSSATATSSVLSPSVSTPTTSKTTIEHANSSTLSGG